MLSNWAVKGGACCLSFKQEWFKKRTFVLHHNNKAVGDNCIFLSLSALIGQYYHYHTTLDLAVSKKLEETGTTLRPLVQFTLT